MTDQLAYIQQQLIDNGYFDGRGQAFGVCGNLYIPDDSELYNIELIQLDQGPSRRTIYKSGGKNIRLDRVKIYRGEDMRIGTITDSAGAWLANIDGLSMNEVAVSGNGPGTGLRIINVNKATFSNLRAEDMRFAADSDPGTEQLVGIWRERCNNFTDIHPVAHRIDGVINGVSRPWQTDGIDFSGCRDFTVIGPQVSFCGEGIDISGTDGNRAFSIIGGNITDCDSYGVKLANSASHGHVIGVTASRCGFSGFVVSGPFTQNLPRCERNRFSECTALETGSNGRWSAYNVTGFSVMTSNYEPGLPEYIIFEGCNAIDGQNVKTMKYGFRNENNNTRNRLRDCDSIGHSIQGTLGVFG